MTVSNGKAVQIYGKSRVPYDFKSGSSSGAQNVLQYVQISRNGVYGSVSESAEGSRVIAVGHDSGVIFAQKFSKLIEGNRGFLNPHLPASKVVYGSNRRILSHE